MSGPVRHREVAFVPMCTPKDGKPWFALEYVRWQQRHARDDFALNVGEQWEALKKEGWRIVRVEVKS